MGVIKADNTLYDLRSLAGQKDRQMKRGLVEVYALAVCFVTLVCFVVAFGIGIYDLIQILNPQFTIDSYTYDRHQSNQAFSINWPKDKPHPQSGELTRLRKESYQSALRSEKRGAFQSLTMVFIIILIDVVVFIIHWYLAMRARESKLAKKLLVEMLRYEQ